MSTINILALTISVIAPCVSLWAYRKASRTMTLQEKLSDAFADLDAATNEMAKRFDELLAQVKAGMSDDEVSAVRDRITAEANLLRSFGATPPAPEPTPDPAPEASPVADQSSVQAA